MVIGSKLRGAGAARGTSCVFLLVAEITHCHWFASLPAALFTSPQQQLWTTILSKSFDALRLCFSAPLAAARAIIAVAGASQVADYALRHYAYR